MQRAVERIAKSILIVAVMHLGMLLGIKKIVEAKPIQWEKKDPMNWVCMI